MAHKLPHEITLTIEKVLPSGEGLAHFEKWPIFLWGVLPGETILAQPVKKRKGSFKAIPLQVLNPSPERREPRDNHYLSSSPYQIFDESLQHRMKVQASLEAFEKAGFSPATPPELIRHERLWHYRNKIEFSFMQESSGRLNLAFHVRHRKSHYHPVTDCSIAHEKINACAKAILAELRAREIPTRSLKSLVVRYAYAEDKCLAALYVKEEAFPVFPMEWERLKGWLILYSDPRSPASVETGRLFQQGSETLEEVLSGKRFSYAYDGFFQAHPPCFEKLLSFLKERLVATQKLLDLYCGAGTIGISLSGIYESVTGVEYDSKAATLARENVQKNGARNVSILAGAAERQDLRTLLETAETLLVDPPRCGLHPQVIRKIKEFPPEFFIYVSCNPQTQADDFTRLKEHYNVIDWKLFDLYPQTPHVESVLLLKRKQA